jgi:hypothetical protein
MCFRQLTGLGGAAANPFGGGGGTSSTGGWLGTAMSAANGAPHPQTGGGWEGMMPPGAGQMPSNIAKPPFYSPNPPPVSAVQGGYSPLGRSMHGAYRTQQP